MVQHAAAGAHGVSYDGLLMSDVLPERKGWWNYRYMWRLNFAILSALLSQATSGYDGSLLNGLQSLPLWVNYFNHPAGATLGTLNVGIYIGQSASSLLAGYFCDKYGRRWPLGVGCWIVIVGSILGAASTNFGMFLGGRILIGFGDGLCQIASPTMLSELSHPSQRVQIQAMYEPSYPLGGIIAAWTTYATFSYTTTWSWRLPMALQGVFALMQFGCLMFCPESPRWLIATGQREKAIAVLVKYHADGDTESPLVRFELAEIDAQIELDSMNKAYSWMEFFRTKGNRRRFWIMCFFPWARQFTGGSLVSYFLPLVLNSAGIRDSKTQLLINGGVNISGFVFAGSTFLYIEKVGRRAVTIGPLAVCVILLMIWTILSALIIESNYTRPELGYGVVLMVFLFQGFIHIYAAAAEPYVQEMSTFALRSKIVVMWQFGAQIINLVASFANPVGMANLSWKYTALYVVFDTIYVIIMYLFFPETKGLSLEESALLFDGDEAIERQHAAEVEFAELGRAHGGHTTAHDLVEGKLESGKASVEHVEKAD